MNRLPTEIREQIFPLLLTHEKDECPLRYFYHTKEGIEEQIDSIAKKGYGLIYVFNKEKTNIIQFYVTHLNDEI